MTRRALLALAAARAVTPESGYGPWEGYLPWPEFATEAEEAAWLYENRDRLDLYLHRRVYKTPEQIRDEHLRRLMDDIRRRQTATARRIDALKRHECCR